MTQTCGSVDSDHSTNGNLNPVYYGPYNQVGVLCDNHVNNNVWCPVCKQFMRISEMYINTDIGIQICLPDALSSRSVTLYSNKLNFALKSDVTVQAATLNTLQQSVATLQSTVASQQTTINSLKTKLGLS